MKIFFQKNDMVISSSICDTNAIAHLIKLINDEYGIINGSVTTLHPWLSYQNLLDGSVISEKNRNLMWPDFALGRSTLNNLIPKKYYGNNCNRKKYYLR